MGKLKILWVLVLAILIVPTLANASGKRCGSSSSGCLKRHGYGYSWYDPPYAPYRYNLRVFPNGDYSYVTPGADYLPYVSRGVNYQSWAGYSDSGHWRGYDGYYDGN